MATGYSIAHYVRTNQIFIDRAMEKDVAASVIASALAKRSGGRWTARQVLKSIYATRHKSKTIREATPQEKLVLDELAREITPPAPATAPSNRSAQTVEPAAPEASLPPAAGAPVPARAGIRTGSREGYLE